MSGVVLYGGSPFPGEMPWPQPVPVPVPFPVSNEPIDINKLIEAAKAAMQQNTPKTSQQDANTELALANYHAMMAFAAALPKVDGKKREELLAALRRVSEALGKIAVLVSGK